VTSPNKLALAAGVAAVLALAGSAVAAPPRAGLFVPGASLGGLKLGQTEAEVRAAWGAGYARCKGCKRPTWYYTFRAFSPKGAGVEFRRGRAAAIFTLWSPRGWRTTRGLQTGDEEAWATKLYHSVKRTECGTYSALVLPGGRAVSVIYVVSGRVWGFGLLSPGSQPCR
jgi:hypothetical protein